MAAPIPTRRPFCCPPALAAPRITGRRRSRHWPRNSASSPTTRPEPDAAAGRCRPATRSPTWQPRSLPCSTNSASGKPTSSATRWVVWSGCNSRWTGRQLVDRLVLVNAWAKTHPHTLRCFATRKSLLLNTGVAAYVRAQPLFLYPAAWLADRQEWLAEQDAAGIAHFPPTETVLRRIQAIEAFDLTAVHPRHHRAHPGDRHARRRAGALHVFDRAGRPVGPGSAGTARPGRPRLQHHRPGGVRYAGDGVPAGTLSAPGRTLLAFVTFGITWPLGQRSPASASRCALAGWGAGAAPRRNK